VTRRRNLIGEPWTDAEDDALRRLARPRPRQRSRHCLPWPRLFVALPSRSKSAIIQRCRELGLRPRSGSAWTDEETRILAARWSEVGQRTLLDALPGRSWIAIHARAMALGLPTIPQGWESLKAACVRCGLDRETGLNVIRWAERQAEVVRALQQWAHAIAARCGLIDSSGRWDQSGWEDGRVEMCAHTTSLSSIRYPSRRWQLVAELALDDALTRYQSWESTAQAAHRFGLAVSLVTRNAKRWLADPTRRKHSQLRMPASWWDDACAHLRRRPGARTIREHAERLGVGRCVVERALQMLGGYQTRAGRRADLLDSEVDSVVRKYLSRPGVVRYRAGRAKRAA
jgi:hypothetical protein